ncbi:alpha/beta hydrolase [Sphingopyxis sp. USTB-05]|uniref:alpha/beta hydrolase n=1 Tax=Sphingopyxis sp. USTB-05 TaxID=2830667 RepID=UPI0020787F7C|nr:alpha/beta hydrolase [Sphingopyxis sp. USTB-05]USI77666.1 alpha/beta fold hydrolase [Sphingopyxis sp. USTB-05]
MLKINHLRWKPWLFGGLTLALAGLAQVGRAETVNIPQRAVAPASCPIEVAPVLAGRVQCGMIEVPENRVRADGRTVRVHFAVVQPEQPTPGRAPILFVMGGNGSGLKNLKRQPGMARFLSLKDTVIYVDHRGSTPWGRPDMSCLEFPEGLEAANPKVDPAKVETCRKSLAARMDINAYGAYEAAQDLRDLRLALGIDRWNVYGVSYGTTIAQRLNAIDGAAISAIVLDGMSGVESNSFDKAFVLQPLVELISECAAAPECAAAFPRFEANLGKAATSLERRPRLIEGRRVSNVEFLDQIRLALAHPDLRGKIPLAVERAAKGDLLAWRGLANPEANSGGKDPAFTWPSSVCRDEFPRIDRPGTGAFPTRKLAPAVVSGARMTAFESYDWARFCPRMGFSMSHPATIAVARSDTPALFLAGQLDLVTPPFQSEETASNFTKSRIVEFPLTFHFVLLNHTECAGRMIVKFFENPVDPLDRACVDELPETRWVLK